MAKSNKEQAKVKKQFGKQSIDVAKVDLRVVDRYLGALGLAADGIPDERVGRLAAAFDPLGEDELSQCDVCGGESDIRLACCPFCGDGEVDAKAASPGQEPAAIAELREKLGVKEAPKQSARAARRRGAAPAAKPEEAAEAVALFGEAKTVAQRVALVRAIAEPARVAAVQELGAAVHATVLAEASEQAEALEAVAGAEKLGDVAALRHFRESYADRPGVCVAIDEAAVRVSREAAAEKGGGDRDVKPDNVAHRDLKPANEVAAEPADGAAALGALEVERASGEIVGPATEADLDRSIARMRSFSKAAGESVYDLGKELFDCFGKKLWLQRRAEGSDRPRYRSWTEFVETEVGIGVHHSYTLMDVAQKFAREDVQLFGSKKLSMILRLPEAAQQEIKPRLGHMSVREVRDEVVSRAGNERRETGRSGFRGTPGPGAPRKDRQEAEAAKPAKPGKGEKAPPPKITVALAVGRSKIPLYARPKTAMAEPKRAKRIGDDPHGVWELPNGAKIRLLVVANRAGELEIQATVEN